jgi:hypothetical protein
VRSTGADVVVGDAGKWITSPGLADRVAYVWLRTPALRRVARRTFAALYLATTHPAGPLEGRWVDPEAARRLATATRGRAGRCAALRRRHASDLALAEVLAWRLGLAAPSTPLVCVGPRQVPAWARRAGLLWRTPDGAVRVTCRSDEASR